MGLPPLFRILKWLPAPQRERILAAAGIAQGLLDARRLPPALDWASRYSGDSRDTWGIALALLANRGRFLAQGTLLSFPDPAAFLRRSVLKGVEHLDAVSREGGTVLLGFHVGPAVSAPALGLHGYHVTFAGEGTRFTWQPPAPWIGSDIAMPDTTLRWSHIATRVSGLYRLRQLLLAGELIGISADGVDGRVAFRVSLPGRSIAIRAGWFTLRRDTGAVTLPVLTHWEPAKVVVTIHPPLPRPVRDVAKDADACQEPLSRILIDYARRFPEQCLSFAFWAH